MKRLTPEEIKKLDIEESTKIFIGDQQEAIHDLEMENRELRKMRDDALFELGKAGMAIQELKSEQDISRKALWRIAKLGQETGVSFEDQALYAVEYASDVIKRLNIPMDQPKESK